MTREWAVTEVDHSALGELGSMELLHLKDMLLLISPGPDQGLYFLVRTYQEQHGFDRMSQSAPTEAAGMCAIASTYCICFLLH